MKVKSMITGLLIIFEFGLSLADDDDHNNTDPCAEPHEHASEFGIDSNYNLSLRIASLFILFAVGFIGILGAIVLGGSNRFKKNKAILVGVQLMKYFGIGVIAATSWVHVLPEAFEVFSDPCMLSRGYWYVFEGAYAGIFGMGAAFVIQGIEFAVISKGHAKKSKKNDEEDPHNVDDKKETEKVSDGTPNDDNEECDRKKEHCNEHVDHEHEIGSLHGIAGHSHNVAHSLGGVDHAATKDIGTIMLELGILVHSVVIGVALGVATEQSWESLFIAICFHQFFEGIALGARIAELKHVTKLWKKLGVGMFFPITAPIGVAIGIAVHLTYANDTYGNLVAVGVLNSIAAGVLIYSTYVELIGLEMNQNKILIESKSYLKTLSFLSMYLGAIGMTVLGIWA